MTKAIFGSTNLLVSDRTTTAEGVEESTTFGLVKQMCTGPENGEGSLQMASSGATQFPEIEEILGS